MMRFPGTRPTPVTSVRRQGTQWNDSFRRYTYMHCRLYVSGHDSYTIYMIMFFSNYIYGLITRFLLFIYLFIAIMILSVLS